MTTKTFPVTGRINLMARVGRGSLTIDTRDDLAAATVELESPADPHAVDEAVVEMRGDTLVVVTPRHGGIFDLPVLGGRDRERQGIDITVTVPAGTAMKLSSYSAPIQVNGRSGSADIAGGACGVDIDEVDGDLRLRLGSGTAEVRTVSGSVQSRTGSGDAHFGEVAGDLTSACGSGDLSVDTIRGRARSRAGSGTASLGVVFGDVDLASGSGELSIGLPAGTAARLDVTTGSGRFDSELPVEDAPNAAAKTITVRARTGSGNVRLFRAA
jgi:hypothetical protein